jgi:hypothetical protein
VHFKLCNIGGYPSQWPHDLRRGSAAARLLELRVRLPLGHGCLVSCESCVLSGRDLCVGLVTCGEESECDREAAIMRRS